MFLLYYKFLSISTSIVAVTLSTQLKPCLPLVCSHGLNKHLEKDFKLLFNLTIVWSFEKKEIFKLKQKQKV